MLSATLKELAREIDDYGSDAERAQLLTILGEADECGGRGADALNRA